MRNNNRVSIDCLRSRLSYDAETGKLAWKECAEMRPHYAGKEAFATPNTHGYLQGRINGVAYVTHRIAWAIYYGEWPDGEIDHVNHDKSDNRIENLRVVTNGQNQRNKSMLRNNKSGVCGVHFERRDKKWFAYANIDNKRHNLGRYDAFEDAVAARQKFVAENDYHANHGVERKQCSAPDYLEKRP